MLELKGYCRQEDLDQLDRDFTYHPPFGNQFKRYTKLREWAKALALDICIKCPPGRERSLALQYLKRAVMWADAGVDRGERQWEEKIQE